MSTGVSLVLGREDMREPVLISGAWCGVGDRQGIGLSGKISAGIWGAQGRAAGPAARGL